MSRSIVALSIAFRLLGYGFAQGSVGEIWVQADKPGIKISPVFYGLMTEEINHAYDGGLYAELLRNRAFSDEPSSPAYWSVVVRGGSSGTIELEKADVPEGVTSTVLKLQISLASHESPVGVANDGYWGIPVRPHTNYLATFYAKASEGFSGPILVALEGSGSRVLATATVHGVSTSWHKFAVKLRTGSVTPSKANRFVISSEQPGTLWLAHTSLFPPTFHNTLNGNRVDLMEQLGELRPAFLRLPGGNYLEGNTIAERFDWKKTIGPIEARPGHRCPWGYPSSDGLGLLEYLEWCEDLHMQPVLAVFAGYALKGEHIPAGTGLAPFVQDALDEIEYVTGPTSSHWGAVRAKNGHPRAFPLTYVEIGNEDWFDRSGSYDGRFAQFFDAIKSKYPKLQIIATTPVKSRKPDVLDDHFYRSARDMERDVAHYDHIPRSGPKIFVGEWASTEGSPTPTLHAALGDAAWLTGLERNSDLVVMEAYAPLLVNVNPGASQWGTNLIGYDALNSFASPSFYVQSMFGKNTGDVVLPSRVEMHVPSPPPPAAPKGAIGVGTNRATAEFSEITVEPSGASEYRPGFGEGTPNWKISGGAWKPEGESLRQEGDALGAMAMTGNAAWQDYILHLKARRVSTIGGLAVYFHAKDAANNVAWTIGGGRGGQNQIVKREEGSFRVIGRGENIVLETGRSYDLRVELKGDTIRCLLDGKQVIEARDTELPPVAPVYIAASEVSSTGEVILKVVNVSSQSQSLDVNLTGVPGSELTCAGWVLSGKPEEMNSVDEPEKIAPKRLAEIRTRARFRHDFPAYSVTILRLDAPSVSGMRWEHPIN